MRSGLHVEDVEHRQRLVDAHQCLTFGGQHAVYQRQMSSAARLIAIRDQLEFAGRRRHTARTDALDQRFVRGAITNQIGDRADAQVV